MIGGELDRMAMAVLQPGFEGTEPPGWLRRALADGLGGVVLFARNVDRDGVRDGVRHGAADSTGEGASAGPANGDAVAGTAALVAELRRERPDVVVAVDEEGGAVTRLEAATGSSWPGNMALGVAGDVSLTRRVARQIGRMVAAAGVTLDYAPVVDVNADPRNPVIGVRSFGCDPEEVGRHGAAWIEGLQSAGVAACAKHFPGHGDTVTDSHLALPAVRASREVIERRDLPPFRAAIAAGVRAVMCGHLLVPAVDTLPATLSREVLTGLLREELGFDGLAVTDAIEMRAVAALHEPGEIAVRALAAGADAICVGVSSAGGESVYALRDAITRAVREGRLAEERLAEAAGRVRDLAAWYDAQAEARAAVARDADEGLGLAAATAALRATPADQAVTPLTKAPLVVHLAARPSQAVGRATPLKLGQAIEEILPGTVTAEVHEDGRLPDLSETGRPLVIAVHDAVRHAWMRRLLDDALRARPDAVVVETGVPGPPAGRLYLATHGNSTACARAAARWLTGGV
ncbi:glycoside hydrolase family 3 protein [Microbispora hainanensis]|uniref:Glycoside hydrolase family 3 protein n=1 Tax=Microbispora hainanensis TaxID=568844 RepID=A0ABZ1SW76_9ACTN|nr:MULTISPECIES: glycoside hydrolase family 3 N-terminal domain-containing protein [Microbispora]NJP26376.1 glycoside hydrolase family 3 protein [Microbispora sp. CL1-1]TQS12466.1 glycoside hydrolase family 3 protein [Microbispora sp. SCL1-1]